MGKPKTEIPEQYKPKASGPLNLRESFSASGGSDEGFQQEAIAQQQKQKTEQIRDWNHTTAQSEEEGTTLRSGRIKLSHVSTEDNRAAEKKKEKYANAIRSAMKQVMEQLAQLDKMIDNLMAENKRLAKEIEDHREDIAKDQNALNATNKLIELRGKDGKLDLTDPQILLLMSQAGISVEEYEKDPGVLDDNKQKLEDRILSNEEQIKLKTEQMEKNHEKIEKLYEQEEIEIDNNPNLSPEEKAELKAEIKSKIRDLKKENKQLGIEREALEKDAGGPVKQKSIEEPASSQAPIDEEVFAGVEWDDSESEIDTEIETFMKEHASVKGQENQMMHEQKLVANLSPEAVEVMSSQEETKHLFEGGYFDQAENLQQTVQSHELKSDGLNKGQSNPLPSPGGT